MIRSTTRVRWKDQLNKKKLWNACKEKVINLCGVHSFPVLNYLPIYRISYPKCQVYSHWYRLRSKVKWFNSSCRLHLQNVCVCVRACVSVCVCVFQRERKKEQWLNSCLIVSPLRLHYPSWRVAHWDSRITDNGTNSRKMERKDKTGHTNMLNLNGAIDNSRT